jgi:IclR family acetate operon transcriptional repressor
MPANNYINVIERMMRVLQAFGQRSEVSLKDLTQRSGMVKSSVFRILYTLEKLGYVSKNENGLYSIRAKFFALMSPAHPTADLIEIAHPLMRGVVDRFKETVNLGVIDGNEVLYIHVVESPLMLRLAAHAGIRSALHSSALGKCLTAYLEPEETARLLKLTFKRMTSRTIATKEKYFEDLAETRKRGFAIDNSEDSEGIRCIGAPIFDVHGCVMAALSLSGPDSRLPWNRDREVAASLQAANARISKMLEVKRKQNANKERQT